MYSKKKTLNEKKKNREKKPKKNWDVNHSRESVATAVFISFVINLTL